MKFAILCSSRDLQTCYSDHERYNLQDYAKPKEVLLYFIFYNAINMSASDVKLCITVPGVPGNTSQWTVCRTVLPRFNDPWCDIERGSVAKPSFQHQKAIRVSQDKAVIVQAEIP
jgi:hypothetical protein